MDTSPFSRLSILARLRRHLGPAVFTLADQAIHSGTNFLTGVVIGRFLSVGDLGVFSLGLTVVTFSLLFQDTLLATPYTYHFHHAGVEARPRLTAGALVQSALLALGLAFVFVVLGGAVLLAGETTLSPVFTALAAAMPFLFVREFFRRMFFTSFQMRAAMTLDAGVSILQFTLLFAFLSAGVLSPVTAWLVLAGAAGGAALVCFLLLRERFDFRDLDIVADTRENLRYGRWLLLGSLCHIGSLYAFPWFLYIQQGKTGTGAFAACMSIVNLLNPLIIGFTNFFRPKLIEVQATQGVRAMNRMILLSAGALVVPVLILVGAMGLFGGSLVTLVYGAGFSGLGPAVFLVSLSLIPTFVNAPIQLGTLALNRPWINPAFHAAGLATTVLVGFPLVHHFGLVGATGGYALTTLSGSVVLGALYARAVRSASGP